MKSKPWTIVAQERGAIEIRLFDDIGESLFSEGTSAKAFAADLEAAGHLTSIHLKVNSGGGSVWEGLAMYQTLVAHGATVTAEVVGLAASIASVIVMAASRIQMARTALLMLHNPYTVTAGESSDMRKMADTLDKVKDSMVTAYRRHTKKTKAEISDIMNAETWFSANEAVDAGFAQEVIAPDEYGDEQLAAAFATPIFAKFKHPPAQVAARLRARHPEAPSASERERQRLRLELLRRL